jgi:hypothetical protein
MRTHHRVTITTGPWPSSPFDEVASLWSDS